MLIKSAAVEPWLDQVRLLFREYQQSLDTDLCFQHFAEELATLPGKYAPPRGRLYLAQADNLPAGCVAVRPLDEHRCELKRLYVRPQFRGRQLGKTLTQQAMAAAKEIGYRQMLLDTLPSMQTAQKLYHALGFREIAPYYANPLPGTKYLAVDL